MKFIELFDSRDKKKRISHIKNLVALACSDGVIDENELKLIFSIFHLLGIQDNDYFQIIGSIVKKGAIFTKR